MSKAAPLETRIRERLADISGRILVAFSGGRDSSVLLHSLALHHDLRPRLLAVHADHRLHPESQRWADHCARRAAELGVDFALRELDVARDDGRGVEASARQARYQALAELLAPGDCLVTAHHAGDQLETLLLRLLRGSGSRGLAGIRESRVLGHGELRRPMLPEPETAVATYAERHRLSWIEDPSNRHLQRDRNYLRHIVLPRIQQRWPGAAETAVRSAYQLAEDGRLLDAVAEEDFGEEFGMRLPLERLARLGPGRQRNLLRWWWQVQTGLPPSSGLLRRVLSECLAAAADAQPEVRRGEWRIRRTPDALVLEKGNEPPVFSGWLAWPDPAAQPLSLPGVGRLRLLSDPEGCFCPDLLQVSLAVGCREGGERFHDGRHHRRLSEWFRRNAVAARDRDRVPLLRARGRLVAAGETLLDPAWRRRSGEEGLRLVWERESGLSD